jgi:phosphocarrier protein
MTQSTVSERTVQIVNRMGLHARPAAEFVKLANRFDAQISVEKDGLRVNGKSIMGVLMLAAEHGSDLLLHGDGPDAAEAVEALSALVAQGFAETLEAEAGSDVDGP